MSSPQQRQQPAPEDVIGCQAALFEWAESFDTKDWDRLRSNLAPTLRVDYRHVMGQMWEAMPADEFVALASNPRFLGDARLRTQHFVGGASRWEQTAAGRVTGRHQVRVAHQRYADDALKEVALKGHAHGERHRVVREGRRRLEVCGDLSGYQVVRVQLRRDVQARVDTS
ncbi:hypothetical protein PG996_008771 [Apiospora saccharicola]|uniref:Scytalone dehydratase-like domain-containing protein n=1 Tax=Apiospora saccharicola TaxID=335842 RepID=A0ABR1UYV6_9PEZI